ncbi:aldose 1-epimerase family protein [Microcella daejeonensis]|uniref:Aldose 1-epimerase family protein n=1 Tax=Microcella daejeonensis TaxID=2994971 RepID=A0A9E8MLT1_9MICO|nr:aldose 1-epimerase family protein [Microcella daejeonensis]WAB81988.1 aldose 1-epimerase family protein [Microcella daejeonensis]
MTPTSAPAPTGEQYALRLDGPNGPVEAVVTEVAAALRQLTVDGHDLTQPYPESATPPFGDGIVLVPWPNRVRDGRWTLDGEAQQLDITEVAKNNAIHGLLRYGAYRLVDRTDSSVTLGAAVVPQHGYPFHLWTTVAYELVPDGVRVTHAVTNLGSAAAPYAVGTHPFLRVGEHSVESLTITARTAEHVMVDARLNPEGLEPVAGTRFDLTSPTLIEGLEFDDAWRVEPDDDGLIRTTVAAPDGASTTLWQQGDWEWLQVFITRIFPTPDGLTTAIAVEPMTAPADALNSGLGLRWIEPGASWSGSWGITRQA